MATCELPLFLWWFYLQGGETACELMRAPVRYLAGPPAFGPLEGTLGPSSDTLQSVMGPSGPDAPSRWCGAPCEDSW